MSNLTPIRVRDGDDDYRGDTNRIIEVLNARGYQCDRGLAKQLWEAVSERSAAGWLHLPEDDDELFSELETCFVVDD